MLSGKTYLPYGPWLSIATVIVLFSWARLWRLTRLTFSDWFSVMVLAAVGAGLFIVLLWLLQLYKTIPTRKPQLPG
jgi:leader peptidase (prepilin peptidase)/N-methyltransferase